MAASIYQEALQRLLDHEGGYSNHPADPGGPTNFGVTLADYRRYVKANATAADVKRMPVSEARAIYRTKYWNALSCDALPVGLDYAVFDYGVNSGITRAAKALQRLCGVDEDGRIGAETLAAVRGCDAAALIESLCDERLTFLRRLKTWAVFGVGWSRRVAEVRGVALQMAKGAAGPVAAPLRRREATGSASPSALVTTGRAVLAGSSGLAVAAGALSLFGWPASHPVVTVALGAVALATLAAIVLGGRWRRAGRGAPVDAAPPVSNQQR